MSYLIKEGYFNLSTMLNLKNLWMPHVQIHADQSKTTIEEGSKHLSSQRDKPK